MLISEKVKTRIAELIERVGPRKKVKNTTKNLKLKKELNSLLVKAIKICEKDFLKELNKGLE